MAKEDRASKEELEWVDEMNGTFTDEEFIDDYMNFDFQLYMVYKGDFINYNNVLFFNKSCKLPKN
ncbi:MAG: hypothetical protein K6E10_10275 [Eubacterium sp.]|nr:hypothetical protein [Eubacterium sp.]